VGNFSGVPGETDLLLRNSHTGGLEVYNIANNQLTGAAFIGTVGLDWQFAGIAPIHAAGASDLVLRNVNTGQFEVYDIATISSLAPPAWARSAWIGSSAVSPPIRRLHLAHSRISRAISWCKRWRGLLTMPVQPMTWILPFSAPTRQRRLF
jgi:hypothetical protein